MAHSPHVLTTNPPATSGEGGLALLQSTAANGSTPPDAGSNPQPNLLGTGDADRAPSGRRCQGCRVRQACRVYATVHRAVKQKIRL